MPVLNTQVPILCAAAHVLQRCQILTLQLQCSLHTYLINFYVDLDAEKEENKTDTIARSSSHLGASSPPLQRPHDHQAPRQHFSHFQWKLSSSPIPLLVLKFYRVYHILVGQFSSTRKLKKQSHTKTLTLIMIQCISITPKEAWRPLSLGPAAVRDAGTSVMGASPR